MQPTTKNKIKEKYTSPQLPLAVYREVVAHLRQVVGVDAGLIVKPLKRDSAAFDYNASQIESLWLEYSSDLSIEQKQQIKAILDYYGDRYKPWQKND